MSDPRGGDEAARARIGWRCRRGLLELDVLLGGFWAAQRDTLGSDEMDALERLLGLDDVEIVDLIEGRGSPGNAATTTLIERLRHFREAK